ncbi:MAG: ABC transporter substrate-binding protein [Pseudonocardia sp. SCN 72-86]|nr:MAG: ABC transporter substrate-binding protein [Pseudonocardia sp. SCN 72-86]
MRSTLLAGPRRGHGGLRAAAAALTASAALLLAACGSGAATGPGADAGPPTPGGTLRFAVSSDQGCLDPQQVTSNDSVYSVRQLVDSLTDQDPATGEIKPWLATTWTVSPDATSYSFTLRPGVTFSDGTPLDANVVKANFDAVPKLGVRASLAKGYLAGYTGTTVTGPDTFTVGFSSPNVQFLQATSTHSLGILSAATVAKTDDERCASAIGSGPFTVGSYTKNQSTILVKRPGYAWGSSLFAHPGEAYLDKLEFRVVPESGVRTGSLQANEVDAITSIGQQDEAPLTAAGAQLLARANPGLPFQIAFNLSKPIVSDPAVRTALSLSINRPEVVSAIYTSQTKPATSALASSTPDYTDQAGQLGFDLAKAQQGLDAAGWTPGPDGIRVKDGQRLTIPVVYANNLGSVKPTLELLQQQAKAAGIDLQLLEKQISDVAALQQSGDFSALWFNLTRADPDILRSQYWSGGVNLLRFPPSPLDQLLTAQASAADPATRTALVADAQRDLLAQHLVVPVVELTTVLAVAPTTHGVTFDASSRIQLHDAWKSQ